jgi:hypothetical protein
MEVLLMTWSSASCGKGFVEAVTIFVDETHLNKHDNQSVSRRKQNKRKINNRCFLFYSETHKIFTILMWVPIFSNH